MSKKNYKPGWRSQSSRGTAERKSAGITAKLKIILPFTILVFVLAIFILPKITNMIENFGSNKAKTIDRILKENPLLENKVINPKFSSVDKKGRPFLIQAEYATNLNKEKTDFIKPSGNLKLEDGSTMTFIGDKGIYDKPNETLEIIDNVNIKTDKGYDLKTEYMILFPKENKGEGHKPIHGKGPSGETIEAEGFKITDKGDIIEFLGNTKISLPG